MYAYEMANDEEHLRWIEHQRTLGKLREVLLSQQTKVECELQGYARESLLPAALVLWSKETAASVARTDGWLQELQDIGRELGKDGNGYI